MPGDYDEDDDWDSDDDFVPLPPLATKPTPKETPKPEPKKIVLQANDYDALELAVLAHRGVGRHADETDRGRPLCIHGMALFLDPRGNMSNRLEKLGLDRSVSDGIASKALGGRKYVTDDSRVTWGKYIKAGHIIRGK